MRFVCFTPFNFRWSAMHGDSGLSAAPEAEPTLRAYEDQIRDLQVRLEECEETLGAIRRGEIDAVVVGDAATAHRVYTLEGADRPYRLLIEQIQEGAVTLSADGIVFYCNRRLAELVGTPQEQVTGHRLQPFLRTDDVHAFEELLGAACHGPARGEFTLRGPNGAETPVYISLSPLHRDESEPLLCGVLADLTQQKLHLRELSEANARLVTESAQREATEEALRQSQKMEAVGQLTGGLAHDFNNLLTGITGSLELIELRVTQGRTGDLGRYIGAATTSANRAAALTHRLLAFSRRQTLDPKLVPANRLVSGMEELLRRTVGPMITIQTVLPTTVGAILCDPNQLESALLNLAINGRDAMSDGGQLTIETATIELDQALAARQDMLPGSYVTISVTDTGTGMTPDVVARAFDPFFTTKPLGEGTGLGLSMIYGFAKQSGGQARIHSTPGIGTTVRVYLPSHQASDVTVVQPQAVAVRPRAVPGETVLVVEDEPVIRMLVVEVLEELGYRTIVAANGISGLRQIETPGRIDLLMTDVGLPNGMNGRQLADAARAFRPDLKVLFITGFSESAAVTSGNMEEGMGVLTKPFTMEALATRIRAMIDTPSMIGRA
jgi:PAS domain S-box-containing protein